jgi:hypothetical protein
MSTRERLKNRPRPTREIDLPGGGSVPVRSLTLTELRTVDRRAADVPEGQEREIRRSELLCLYAMCEPNGCPAFPDATDADLADVGELTPDDIKAVVEAVLPSRADAKND